MSLRRRLYSASRTVSYIEALTSGSPRRIFRRFVLNRLIGKAMARSGLTRALWGGRSR